MIISGLERVMSAKERIVETERLFLRKMNIGDFDALYQIIADPDTMQHYPHAFDDYSGVAEPPVPIK